MGNRSFWDKRNPDDILGFTEFGLDRDIPDWIPFNQDYALLNLGAGHKHHPDFISLDWPDWDADKDPLPYEDNSVGGVIAMHFLEHLSEPRDVIREVGRVLVPGAPFNILVPHANSLMFLHDLDHKKPFVIDTWKNLLDQPYYDKMKNDYPFRIGANFLFGLKEANLALITQLIKKEQ